jgi:hypothetical protein
VYEFIEHLLATHNVYVVDCVTPNRNKEKVNGRTAEIMCTCSGFIFLLFKSAWS